jgi:hypothetical protein
MTANIYPPSPTQSELSQSELCQSELCQSELSQSELSGDSLPANLFATLPPDLKNDRCPNGGSRLASEPRSPSSAS